MIDTSVQIALISAISGILIAYVTNVLSQKYQKKKAEKQPKDRMEQMFDGYERLIKQKDIEDERKVKLMAELEEEIVASREMIRKLEHSLAVTQQELALSRQENQELKTMLSTMRKEYELAKQKILDEEHE